MNLRTQARMYKYTHAKKHIQTQTDLKLLGAVLPGSGETNRVPAPSLISKV